MATAAAANSAPSKIIRIRIGEPPAVVRFTERPSAAKEVEGREGPEFMHSVDNGGRIIYLPAQAQEDLVAFTGDKPMEIGISRKWQGRGKSVYEFSSTAPAKQQRIEGAQSYSQPATRGANAMQPAAADPAPTMKYRMPPAVDLLAGCLVAAIKAANIAAQETGCKLTDERTIQALASTLFIHAAKAERC